MIKRVPITSLRWPAHLRPTGRRRVVYELLCANPGMTLSDLAGRIGAGVPTASRFAAMFGYPLKPRAGSAVEAYAGVDWSQPDAVIARQKGVSNQSIGRARRAIARHREFRKLHHMGVVNWNLANAQIAKRYGVSANLVFHERARLMAS